MAGINVPGLGSGIDINGLVSQLVAVERAPAQRQIDARRAEIGTKISALGQLNGALDAVRTAFNGLRDGSVFARKVATSADAAVFTATAASTAAAGTYSVEVQDLASSQRLTSGAFASASTAVGTGTLSLSVGGQTLQLTLDASNNSLSAIASAINASADNPGIDASVVTGNDGAHLVLNARKTGSAGAITVSASGGDGGLVALQFLGPGDPGNALSETSPAADALVKIDGIAVSASGNQVTDAISGVTLNLLKAQPGTSVQLTVTSDRAGILQAVGNLVSKYNDFVGVADTLAAFNANTGSAGPLLGDSTLRSARSDLIAALSVRAADGSGALSDLGIRFQLDGRLELDTTVLGAKLDAGIPQVAALFADGSPLANGIGRVAARYLDSGGVIAVRSNSLTSSQRDLDRQQERLDLRLAATEARLRAQFTALDSLLSRLQATSSFLSQQAIGASQSSSR